MKITVDEMRKSHESYRAFIKSSNWEKHPVYEWFGRKYVVTGNIELTDVLQRLEVIDITDDTTNGGIALFSNSWPEYSESKRRYALIDHADEGHDCILKENGYTASWVRYADLPIRVISGTKQDFVSVRMAQMDELEESVDNGGSIF